MDNCFIFDSIPPRWWAFAYGPLFTYAYSSVFSHAISIRKSSRRTKTFGAYGCVVRVLTAVFMFMPVLRASSLRRCVCAYVCVVRVVTAVCLCLCLYMCCGCPQYGCAYACAYVVVKSKLKMR